MRPAGASATGASPGARRRRGSLTFAGHAGLNTVRFNGWLSRTKKLKPGKYTLAITATTPGVGDTVPAAAVQDRPLAMARAVGQVGNRK